MSKDRNCIVSHSATIGSDLTDAAVREPKSICIQALSIAIESHKSLLHKLLRTGGCESSRYLAQPWALACSYKV